MLRDLRVSSVNASSLGFGPCLGWLALAALSCSLILGTGCRRSTVWLGRAGPDEIKTGTAGSSGAASSAGTSGSAADAGVSDAAVADAGTIQTGTDSSDPEELDASTTVGTAGARASGVAGSAGANAGAGGRDQPDTAASCLADRAPYDAQGPFRFEMKVSGSVTLRVPVVPAGCKVPIVNMANNTGAACSTSQALHERLASHGFLTTCFEEANSGAGTGGLKALETALAMYPDLADNKLGAGGQTQGGQGAIVTLQLAEAKWGSRMIYAGLAAAPASGFGTQPEDGTWQEVYGMVRSPIFMFRGTADSLVSRAWVQEGFDALRADVEAYFYEAVGAQSDPMPLEWLQQSAVSWFRWKLLGDQAACRYFKALPDGALWDRVTEKNPMDCP